MRRRCAEGEYWHPWEQLVDNVTELPSKPLKHMDHAECLDALTLNPGSLTGVGRLEKQQSLSRGLSFV